LLCLALGLGIQLPSTLAIILDYLGYKKYFLHLLEYN